MTGLQCKAMNHIGPETFAIGWAQQVGWAQQACAPTWLGGGVAVVVRAEQAGRILACYLRPSVPGHFLLIPNHVLRHDLADGKSVWTFGLTLAAVSALLDAGHDGPSPLTEDTLLR